MIEFSKYLLLVIYSKLDLLRKIADIIKAERIVNVFDDKNVLVNDIWTRQTQKD